MRLLAAHPNLDNRRVILYKQTHRLPSQLPHAREIPHSVMFLESNYFGRVGFSLHIAPLSTEIARRHLHFSSIISISRIQIIQCEICVALKGNRFAPGRKKTTLAPIPPCYLHLLLSNTSHGVKGGVKGSHWGGVKVGQ
jgi:hypothetical protein